MGFFNGYKTYVNLVNYINFASIGATL